MIPPASRRWWTAISSAAAPRQARKLVTAPKREPLSGITGIGHTRWATHGAPTERNAHPHASERVAVVHNGIIENFRELRDELSSRGHDSRPRPTPKSWSISSPISRPGHDAGRSRADGGQAPERRLRARHDLHRRGIASRSAPAAAARSPSAMAKSECISAPTLSRSRRSPTASPISKTATSRSPRRQRQDLRRRGARAIAHDPDRARLGAALVDKGNHRHFMAKEIYEQPKSSATRCRAISTPRPRVLCRPRSRFSRRAAAHHVGLRHGLLCRPHRQILVRAARAAAGRGRCRVRAPLSQPGLSRGGLALFVSQSGETADTLAALRHARSGPAHRLRRQRAGKLDRARIRSRLPHLCRPRDRRRLHQGLHLPALGARLARHRRGRARGTIAQRREAPCAL